MQQYRYYYSANYVSNYDGDTIRFDIDLGFETWLHNQAVRLFGLDTPEVRGEEKVQGKVVKALVQQALEGREIVLYTLEDKKGKYGRWLAIVHFLNDEGEWINLNNWLLAEGHAEPMAY